MGRIQKLSDQPARLNSDLQAHREILSPGLKAESNRGRQETRSPCLCIGVCTHMHISPYLSQHHQLASCKGCSGGTSRYLNSKITFEGKVWIGWWVRTWGKSLWSLQFPCMLLATDILESIALWLIPSLAWSLHCRHE